MSDWCITIVPGTGAARFVPDVYSESGTPPAVLQADQGDVISWSNQTSETHEIWLTDASFQPRIKLTDGIAPNRSSQPGYVVQLGDASPDPGSSPKFPLTIYYACSLHPSEHGEISLIA